MAKELYDMAEVCGSAVGEAVQLIGPEKFCGICLRDIKVGNG
jgi:hypothetical protein